MWSEFIEYVLLRLVQVGIIVMTFGAMYEVYKLL